MVNFNKADPSIIWVSAGCACSCSHDTPHAAHSTPSGTFDNPFDSIPDALTHVTPGKKIVLLPGTYDGGDTNFEISGTINHPVHIVSHEKHKAVITGACWFFYDCSDLVVSGLTFSDAPLGAIAVIGRCQRNRFEEISFVNCGTQRKTACTLFFGGSGVRCNIVEACAFTRSTELHAQSDAGLERASIGLMVSDGQSPGMTKQEGVQPNQDQLFRKNSFVNYDYGVMVGSLDSTDFENGTIVEYNSIDRCRNGISVKSGDTSVRGNVLSNCSERSIAVLAGRGSRVLDNRVTDCTVGVAVRGKAHSILNNCLVRCRNSAVHALGDSVEGIVAAQNLLIENNTCIECGSRPMADAAAAAVFLDAGTTAIIERNLFTGTGRAVVSGNAAELKSQVLITENAVSEATPPQEGCEPQTIEFAQIEKDNYTNNSGFGASGHACSSASFDPDKGISRANPVCFAEPTLSEQVPVPDDDENAPPEEPLLDEQETDCLSEAPLYFPEADDEVLDEDGFPESEDDR